MKDFKKINEPTVDSLRDKTGKPLARFIQKRERTQF